MNYTWEEESVSLVKTARKREDSELYTEFCSDQMDQDGTMKWPCIIQAVLLMSGGLFSNSFDQT